MFRAKDIRNFIFIAPIVSAAALLSAYTAEYGFGLKPCHLCLYQRIPYAVIIAVSLLGVIWIKLSGKNLFKKNFLTFTAAVFATIFFAESILAVYHAGVEWNWFEGPDCASLGNASSIEEMRKIISEAPLVSCRDAAFVFMGLSMAGWNALFSGALAVFYCWYFLRIKKYGR